MGAPLEGRARSSAVDPCIVAGGFEPEVTRIYGMRLEDELSMAFFERSGLQRHRAFTRNHPNFILRKPA